MIRLIDTQDVKDATTIQQNVDANIIIPFIFVAQDSHLDEILGSNYLEHILEAFDNNTLTADETTLLNDYIKPMLIWWTYTECYPHINFKPTNKAISKENSEYGSHSTIDEIKYMQNNIRLTAQSLTTKLYKFLCKNANDYPLWRNPNDPKEVTKKRNVDFFSGIYTGGSRPYFGSSEEYTFWKNR